MKEKDSKLNDPAYFEALQNKMLGFAEEHPHTAKKIFPMNLKWMAVASILILGITSFFYLNQKPEEHSQIAINPPHQIDTPKKTDVVAIDVKEDPTIIPVLTTIQEVQVKQLEILSTSEEVIDEVVPLESAETEEDLLDQITEDELDELLKEYS